MVVIVCVLIKLTENIRIKANKNYREKYLFHFSFLILMNQFVVRTLKIASFEFAGDSDIVLMDSPSLWG